MNYLEKSLFTTNSIKIAPSQTPFWYTSGMIGPYFINTHFLYGSEKNANELLKFIDENKNKIDSFMVDITSKVVEFYNTNELYKKVIDIFLNKLNEINLFKKCDYISGGERRDWFFSPIIAYLTGKKHLFIYKDLNVYYDNKIITDIQGANVCHICDLITQASSHNRAWLPAIKKINGNLILNASIIDRDEGGVKFFKKNKIVNISMVTIDKNFLKVLLNNNIINKDQLKQILTYKENPIKFGKKFLLSNINYLKDSIQNPEIKSKVQRCIDENPYNIKLNSLI